MSDRPTPETDQASFSTVIQGELVKASLARLVRPLGHTGGSGYGRAVMDRNAAEELAREAYKNGDMKRRDEMLVEYRAAKERVRLLQQNSPALPPTVGSGECSTNQ